MIVKKPYAFLIKYFRIIHLLLLIPMFYLISKTRGIVSFFNDFIANSYSTNIIDITGEYISIFMYLAIILIIGVTLAIYYLMRQKKKSTNFYLFTIIYYIILLIFMIIANSIMASMETDIITAQAARAYRDIGQVVILPEFFFLIYMIIRGIGFDIKKFDFKNDLKDLEISEADKEEVEVSLNLESYRIKRRIHRFIREFTYYIKENKFIFSIIASILVIVLGRFLFVNLYVKNKSYVINDQMNHKNFSIKVSDSILTNLSYDGNIITPGKYYLVLKLDIENTSTKSLELDYNNFRLNINNKNVYPTLDRGHYFADFGKPYQKEKIKSKAKDTYILAYELTEKDKKKEYQIRILENVTYTQNEIESNYKIVNVKPKLIENITEHSTYDLGKILTLKDTNIGYTTFQINSSEITNNYIYNYEQCYQNNTCQTVKDHVSHNTATKTTLLVLKGAFNIDTTTNYYKSKRDFFNDFVAVRYTLSNDVKISKAINRTPKNIQDTIILEVSDEIIGADDMELIVTIRNIRYTMKLK